MRVGHLVGSYLRVTENWIHSQITAGGTIQPLVLNRGDRINDDLFPVGQAWHLSDLEGGACRVEADGWESNGYSPVFSEAFLAHRGDLLHAHFGPEGVLGVPLAAALGVPLVTSFYGYDASVLPRDPAWHRALGRLFSVGTMFLAEGPALADTLIRIGCPADRVRLAPLPVSIPARPARPPRGAPPLILVCGRLVEKKGVDTSLRVLARLRDITNRPFRAVVVGDGPDRDRLEALHASLRLDDTVELAGAVTPVEFSRQLRSATAILQMSRVATDGDSEGGAPVVLSQALASGVPVVSTRHCDIPWIVEDGRAGFLVESSDVRQAAAHLARLIEQPELQRACARAGRESARRRWSASIASDTLERHYAEALSLGPVAREARRMRLHPGLLTDVVLDLRRRAQDIDGLARLAANSRIDRARRCQAHRAAGQAYERLTDYASAAHAFGRWRRLMPADPHASLEEGRAWLRTRTPVRAVAPLALFVGTHNCRAYALGIVIAELQSIPEAGARLVRLLGRRVDTPAERFVCEFRALEHVAHAMAPRVVRLRLRRLFEALRPVTAVRQPSSGESSFETALVDAYILALRLGDRSLATRLQFLREPGRLSQPLIRYRMASALAGRGGAAGDWARQTFGELASQTTLASDTRAGALFHLAEIDHRRGLTRHARRALDRCLAIAPAHLAAVRLRELLSPNPRAAS